MRTAAPARCDASVNRQEGYPAVRIICIAVPFVAFNYTMNTIRIVIVGAGFGGIYALKRFHQLFHGNARIQITLVSEKNYFLFIPLLHEVATGSINQSNIIEPIRKFLGCYINTLHIARATQVNLAQRTLDTTDGILSYDYLVLAPGSETNFYGTPGAQEHSFILKSLDGALKLKNHCIAMIEQGSHIGDRDKRKNALRFVIVCGGPTGVELAAELEEFMKHTFARYYSKEVMDDVSIMVLQKGSEVLPQFAKPLRAKSLEVLTKKGIDVRLQTSVTRVTGDVIELSDGSTLGTRTVVWTAGVKPVRIPFAEDVREGNGGKIAVNRYLHLEAYPEVYAIGDVAEVKTADGAALPALAQVAVQEAQIAADNIRRHIDGQALEPFSYKSAGSLVSLGQWMAVGEISRVVLWGHFTWWLWRANYLYHLISWRKKLQVMLDWTLNSFSPRDISQV